MKRTPTTNAAIQADLAIQTRLQQVNAELRKSRLDRATLRKLETERRKLQAELNAIYR